MSIAAYTTGVRNYLRSNLTNFYDGDETDIARNCKVMPDEKPTPDAGQEFISIYGSYHQPRNKGYMEAIQEEFGITIAVSRKIAVVPQDYRGELGYIDSKTLPETLAQDDLDSWNASWVSVEARCREIVKLTCGQHKYTLMQSVNDLLSGGSAFLEPMKWLHTDAYPKQVGPDHFTSYDDLEPDADPIFGLVMKVYLGEAMRLQSMAVLDELP